MREQELAEYYEKRKGDTSLWADKPTKANVRRGGSVVFSIRLSRQELAQLRERAEKEGKTVSEVIRWGALRAAETPSRVHVVTTSREFDMLPSVSATYMTLASMTENVHVAVMVEVPGDRSSYTEWNRVPVPRPRESGSELVSSISDDR
jgi:hypothetical protein